MPAPLDFSVAPFLAIWETTQACDLVCKHCRAMAQPLRSRNELTTDEGKNLLDQVADMGTRIMVLSGGDPVKRPDLFELIAHGKKRDLRMGTIPAAAPTLTRELIRNLKKTGLDQVAFSLDFPRAELHDEFRGVPGAFDRTIEATHWAHEFGIPLQINTTIMASSLPYLKEMGELAIRLGTVFWEVFFLVPTGRGNALQHLNSEMCERAFETLYELNRAHDFVLKVTEAPHYRRYVCEREGGITSTRTMPAQLRRAIGPGGSIGLAPKTVNSGNGFMFVSHEGELFPSGFLPIRAGNIRTDRLADVYRNSRLFFDLRNPKLLIGNCGGCVYRSICGGSRSRAYAVNGNYLGGEPWCTFPESRSESVKKSSIA
ncbi:MAG TPA: TIGR04053 family radical SAM/SPASM domain-containing protein [Bdellovibrionota bacterium]|nr:TIGR04053 family radical SAM/SPASM domain-containing protein [Bdellovibrionota bacterium]